MRITHFLKNYGLRFRVETGRSGFLPALEMLRPRSLKPAFPARLLHARVPRQFLCGAFTPPRLGRSETRCRRGILPGLLLQVNAHESCQRHLHPASRADAIPLGKSHGDTAVPSNPPRPPPALRGSSQSSAPPRDPPRSVPPIRAAALTPGAGRRRPSPA